MRGLALYVALALTAMGCILPVATGAAMPATTVGHGRGGVAIAGEAPTLDLIARSDNTNSTDYKQTYAASPAAAATLTISYGLTDSTDLELAGEGALYYFILPLPTGGSIGLRQHLAATDMFDLAIAGRIGGVSSSDTTTDSSGNSTKDTASATYGAIQGVMQTRKGPVRPLAAINVMPFRIHRQLGSEPDQKFRGVASSLTLGLMFVGHHVQAGPYVTVTNFESEEFSGGWFASGGLMVAYRPDRNEEKRPEPVYPAYPAYPPQPYPPQPYPPQPYPPQPYPAPAPAPEPAPAPAPVP